jgi:hypothetical protein
MLGRSSRPPTTLTRAASPVTAAAEHRGGRLLPTPAGRRQDPLSAAAAGAR